MKGEGEGGVEMVKGERGEEVHGKLGESVWRW